jgi:iron complex outermembrane recepter protein
MNFIIRYPLKIIIVNLLLPSCVFAATAEIELEQITVTSSKSRPSFNTEAVSKNQLTGRELTERGINDISDVTQRIGNFHLTNLGLGSLEQRFSLRGLTNTALFSDPSVVFYVDDVPYASSSTTMGHLVNIESVDVYRGAQPGRFGKNAYAGAVDIKTKQPDNKLSGAVAMELGSYDFYQVTANGSGALIDDRLYISLSGEYQQREGFLYNNYLNTHPDNQENFSGRAALKWTPTKNWDIRFTATKENFDSGAARFVRLDSPDFFTVRSEFSEYLKQQADSQALRMAYNTNDIEFLSVSSRRLWKMQRSTDLNLTPVQFNRIQDFSQEAWTQEFRLRSKNNNSDWVWQTGLFYSTIDKPGISDTIIFNTTTRNKVKKLNFENYAAFGQLNYQGIKDVKAYFDVRFDYVTARVEAENLSPNGSRIALQQDDKAFFVSPKFGIDYTVSPNALVYISSGLSSKRPGFTGANPNQTVSYYKKETVWQNEMGLKTNWLDKRFQLNLAGFYYDIDNYQVERFFSNLDYGLANATKAHSYGFEVESQTKIIDNLWLETALGYTHTQFDEYRDPITDVNYAGKVAPFVPDFTSTVALQYKDSDGYFARAEWLWTGKTYFDENNTSLMSQNDYSTANLRIGYAQKNYSIYGFASNITDNHYYTYKIGGTRGTPGEPRMIGVRLGVSF